MMMILTRGIWCIVILAQTEIRETDGRTVRSRRQVQNVFNRIVGSLFGGSQQHTRRPVVDSSIRSNVFGSAFAQLLNGDVPLLPSKRHRIPQDSISLSTVTSGSSTSLPTSTALTIVNPINDVIDVITHGKPVVETGRKVIIGSSKIGTSDGFNVLGFGQTYGGGVQFKDGVFTSEDGSSVNAFGRPIVSNSDKTDVDLLNWRICDVEELNTFIGNLRTNRKCLDLGFLKQLTGIDDSAFKDTFGGNGFGGLIGR